MPTYTQVCTKSECGYASPPPYRRISDSVWDMLLNRYRPNPIYQPGGEKPYRPLVKIVPKPEPPPKPSPPERKPDVLRPGDAPICAAGHDRLTFGRLRMEKGRRLPNWRCLQCRRDRLEGYAKPVPEAERRCRRGHLLAGNSFAQFTRGRTIVRCQVCFAINAERWAGITRGRRAARKAVRA